MLKYKHTRKDHPTVLENRTHTFSVRQDDVRTLSSQLQSDFLQVTAACSLLDEMTHLMDTERERLIVTSSHYTFTAKTILLMQKIML